MEYNRKLCTKDYISLMIIVFAMFNLWDMGWFPANRDPYPLSFKFEGDDGVLVTVSEVTIKHTEEKIYYGEKSLEYRCDVIIGGIRKRNQ